MQTLWTALHHLVIYSSQRIVQLIVKLKSTVKTFVETKWFIIISRLLSISTTVHVYSSILRSVRFITQIYYDTINFVCNQNDA